jgi:5'-nucleotidase
MNLGQDAFYSGTVAAAREAALRKIPALATSAHPKIDLGVAADLSARAAFELLASRPATGTLLSLNIPRQWAGEVRATRLGARIYEELVDFRTDPRGREYLWLGGPGVRHERDAGTDTDAYDDGAASLTPLLLDLTGTAEHTIVEAIATRVAGKRS